MAEIISSEVKALKVKAYDLFNKGKNVEAFKVLEEEMYQKAVDSGNVFSQLFTYLVIAR
jgi:hypothetical protein